MAELSSAHPRLSGSWWDRQGRGCASVEDSGDSTDPSETDLSSGEPSFLKLAWVDVSFNPDVVSGQIWTVFVFGDLIFQQIRYAESKGELLPPPPQISKAQGKETTRKY